jgi:hypothetical protein
LRHLFDQYSQPENRLTHALVMGLSHDEKLLRKFIQQFIQHRIPGKTKIYVVEQSVPGTLESTEEEAEKRGLPDAWIYTDEGWSLLIESKVQAALNTNQLKRHLSTARRKGFKDVTLMVLATEDNLKKLPRDIIGIPWTKVYEWLVGRVHQSKWAKEITSYMEIAEAKMAGKEYLKEGTLTKFSGVYFSQQNPFTYLESKRILGLIMDELRRRKKLWKLGVDPSLPGRSAIKAYKSWAVWDFMRLKGASKDENFTKYPHLTVSVHSDHARGSVTFPNAVEKNIHKNIFGRGIESFQELVTEAAYGMRKVTQLDPAAQPYIQVIQRHYLSQSSPPVEDAVLKYDFRTTINTRKSKVQKFQPQWLQATYDVMTARRSNIQFELGVIFPYRESKIIKSSKAIDALEASFVAMSPFLKTAIGRGNS